MLSIKPTISSTSSACVVKYKDVKHLEYKDVKHCNKNAADLRNYKYLEN
jgi:hypothetical protein